MSVEEHRKQVPLVLGYAVITVSDSRSLDDDKSGHRVAEMVTSQGHFLRERLLVPDEVPQIREALGRLLVRDDIDVVVLTGGTGLSPRDRTHEAVTPLLERPIEGFGELFRMLSFQEVGAAAMLSRATAGLAARVAVFAIPGSPSAVTTAMERLILPEAAHLLGQARKSES